MSSSTQTANRDFYEVLGVHPAAAPAELRRAYRALARRLHPDVNSAPDAADRFATIAQAYETLSDPARRRAYDLARTLGSGPPSWSGSGVPDTTHRRGVPHHARRGPAVEPSLRGPDIEQTVHLTLREAAFGTDKTITVSRHEVCLTCRGSGAAPGTAVRQCPRCHGTGRGYRRGQVCERCLGSGGIPTVACAFCGGRGRVPGESAFPLRFPPAIEDGETLRIKNEGDPGPQGGPRGDLRLHIVVEHDPVLRRRGSEVYADIRITPDQAARGERIAVPTLHGQSHVRLPRGVADGTTIVMPRQGLRLKGRWRRGDQHVTIHIES